MCSELTATGSTAEQIVPKRSAEEIVKLTPDTESLPVRSRPAWNSPKRHSPEGKQGGGGGGEGGGRGGGGGGGGREGGGGGGGGRG